MPRQFFTVKTIPPTYLSRFIQLACLVPIVGSCANFYNVGPRGKAAIDMGKLTLVAAGRWQRRVRTFVDWAYRGAPEFRLFLDSFDAPSFRAVSMSRCAPAPAFCSPATRRCREIRLCPFCAARAGRKVWRRIDAKLFPVISSDQSVKPQQLAHRDDLALATRIYYYWVPADRPETLKALIDVRTDPVMRSSFENRAQSWLTLQRTGAVGGLEVIHIHSRLGQTGRPPGYVVEFRQLLIFDRNSSGVEALQQVDTDAVLFPRTRLRVEVHPAASLTRRALLDAAAEALRYDHMIMASDYDGVSLYLAARRGHRMVATFGELHGNGTAVVAPRCISCG